MVVRARIWRKISTPPKIRGFKPYSEEEEKPAVECVTLLFEEYEALRLCDYEGLNHQQAAHHMGTSRPTFTRIYASALRKIATAFVEGKQISIESGKVFFESNWYYCQNCECYFNAHDHDNTSVCCPICRKKKIHKLGNDEVILSLNRKFSVGNQCSHCGTKLEILNQGRKKHYNCHQRYLTT